MKILCSFDTVFPHVGPPYVREVGPVEGVEGAQLVVHCPVSGYPIDRINWSKGRL